MSFEINATLSPIAQNVKQASSMNTTTDAEIDNTTDTSSVQQQANIGKILCVLVPELATDAASAPCNAKSVLDQIDALISDYSEDDIAGLGNSLGVKTSLPQVALVNRQPSGDVDAIKKDLDSRKSALEKQLNQFNAAAQDDTLRANANYNAILPKLRAQGEEETDLDGSPWSTIEDSIKNIKENYLDFYSNLMNQYTEMYRKYNEIVGGAYQDAVEKGSDSNNVMFDGKKMFDAFKTFKEKIDDLSLGSVPGWDKMSPEQQKSMANDLKPAFEVNKDTGEVSFNLTEFNTLKNNELTQENSDKQEVFIYKYQAWQANFNSVGSAFQSNMNSFAQRYKQANDTANNLYKLLSGSISTWGEILKGMVQAWR